MTKARMSPHPILTAVLLANRERTPKRLSEAADCPHVTVSSNAAILATGAGVGPLLPRVEAGADGRCFDHPGQFDRKRIRARGKIMANDEEWVADVKRWCLAGTRSAVTNGLDRDDAADEIALGYEAADPALLAHHWPDAPTTGR